MLTLISVPSDFASSTFSIAGSLLTDLSPIWMTIMGVMICLVIVVVIIKAISK